MNGIEALTFIAKRGVDVKLLDNNTFYVDGFYKSGGVEVDIKTNTIKARYDEITIVPEWNNLLETLINLNEDWQRKSAWRYDGWSNMDLRWALIKEDYEEYSSNQ